MKKILLLVFALFITVAVSAQEKKTFEAAVEYAKLDKNEATKVLAIHNERTASIKAIKKQKLDKETEKEKIKAVRQEASKKIKAIIGKEKMKELNAYWKKS
ncbi:hypothetical protein FUA26_12155 [Seonamhaeicola algicola]|uniref:Uncharacterized protein n=1 Tax=Seonamhaeicola algicola TaxID=1719036 RepID=A0A5C7AI31_9FLAO|nr:hypothetical protein [Seonamhaeicola algicola]TXE08081.1 hypothetical protein FUA26_12155 [Seonamhaeicola algicola]